MPLYGRDALLPERLRILFIGDGIADDIYIAYMEAYFRLHAPLSDIELIGLGSGRIAVPVPGEEERPFPQHCPQEQLERALGATRPDWVVVCCGINGDVCRSFDAEPSRVWRDGLTRALARIREWGARAVAMTPPPAVPPYADCDDTRRHVGWVLALEGDAADAVVDIRAALLADAEAWRAADAEDAPRDGVSLNAAGHWVIARTLLKTLFNVALTRTPDRLGFGSGEPLFAATLARRRLLNSAWQARVGQADPLRTAEALTPETAWTEADEIEKRIRTLIDAAPRLRTALGRSEWEGHERTDFMLDGREGFVVTPRTVAPGRLWLWRAEFFGDFAQVDLALLDAGWHLAYYRLSDQYGCPGAVERMGRFQAYVTEQFGLAERAALLGLSRGGLYAFNYAATYPERVSMLYLDAPALDIRSWPGGLGAGIGAAREWAECLAVYGLDERTAAGATGISPLDRIEAAAKARIPILLVSGDADIVVPYAENGALLAQRYSRLGGPIQTIVKPGVGHHPHSLPDPTPIVAFILGCS